jgi:CO/xanthine dehydrogenase FAD-binding subunit
VGDFRFFRPAALGELLDVKAREGNGARILDGGSNVLVYIKEGSLAGGTLVDVKFLEELKGVEIRDGKVEIGAGELIADIVSSPLIEKQVPFLRDALKRFANPLVRNMATLGGNIGDSSPIGDSIPPLLVLEAELILASSTSRRTVALEEFFTGPGKNILEEREVILRVQFPVPEAGTGGHIKLGLRKGTSCSVVSAAVWVVAEKGRVEDIRIALGGVAPTALRARKTEAAFKGQSPDWDRITALSETVRQEISPITDVRGSAEYRRQVSASLVAKAVRQALAMEE